MQRQALDGTNPFAPITLFHSKSIRERQNANGSDIYIRINWARISWHAGEAALSQGSECNNVTFR